MATKVKRVRINRKKNEVTLSFNKDFYPQEFIDQAISDYIDAADISRTDEGLILRPKDSKDLEIIGYEMYNYVLGLIKNK